jgi:hypothetical protein
LRAFCMRHEIWRHRRLVVDAARADLAQTSFLGSPAFAFTSTCPVAYKPTGEAWLGTSTSKNTTFPRYGEIR